MKVAIILVSLIGLGLVLWISRNILKNWGEKVNHLEMWSQVGRNIRNWANANQTGRLETTIVPAKESSFGGHIFVTWRFGEESDPVLQMRYLQEQPVNRIFIGFSLHGRSDGFHNMTPKEFNAFLWHLEREIQRYESPRQKNGKSRLP